MLASGTFRVYATYLYVVDIRQNVVSLSFDTAIFFRDLDEHGQFIVDNYKFLQLVIID